MEFFAAENFHREPKVTLENENLWQEFHELQNEMIITKNGRQVFPRIQIKVSDLNPNSHYYCYIELLSEKGKYKYMKNSGWVKSDQCGDIPETKNIYQHEDGFQSGKFWMRQPIKFNKIKLTNNSAGQGFRVYSNHKYGFRFIISEVQLPDDNSLKLLYHELPVTTFISVTAYQNDKIRSLKIKYNPYAKGFRDTTDVDRKQQNKNAANLVPDVNYQSQMNESEDDIIDVETPEPPLSLSSEENASMRLRLHSDDMDTSNSSFRSGSMNSLLSNDPCESINSRMKLPNAPIKPIPIAPSRYLPSSNCVQCFNDTIKSRIYIIPSDPTQMLYSVPSCNPVAIPNQPQAFNFINQSPQPSNNPYIQRSPPVSRLTDFSINSILNRNTGMIQNSNNNNS